MFGRKKQNRPIHEELRVMKRLGSLAKNADVKGRYPLAYEDPGFLEAVRVRAGKDCERALANGSIDESSVGIFANAVVDAALAKTRAAFGTVAARNEEVLHALEAAECAQLAYLISIRSSYEIGTNYDR